MFYVFLDPFVPAPLYFLLWVYDVSKYALSPSTKWMLKNLLNFTNPVNTQNPKHRNPEEPIIHFILASSQWQILEFSSHNLNNDWIYSHHPIKRLLTHQSFVKDISCRNRRQSCKQNKPKHMSFLFWYAWSD